MTFNSDLNGINFTLRLFNVYKETQRRNTSINEGKEYVKATKEKNVT